ncbi:hypothetical protein OH77DRAFT_1507226 [Trametes cingulata]|nr:hypothetical protein OH77DRAFT_1507226 [Trametes cingulata]
MYKDKHNKGKKKSKSRSEPQPGAPPRTLAPLRTHGPTTSDMPVSRLLLTPSMPNPSEHASGSMQPSSHTQVQMHPASEEDVHERPLSTHNDVAAEKHARKREKKLAKILDFMEHGRTTDRSSEEIKGMRLAARLISTHDALVCGPGHAGDSDGDGASSNEDVDEDEDEDQRMSRLQVQEQERELRYQYNALLDIMPDLKTDINLLDDDQLVRYARYVDYCAHASHGDDTSAVRLDGIILMSDETMRPTAAYACAPPQLQKYQHSWNNSYTARLLCPQDMLKEFDADPAAFCTAVMSGEKEITPAQYPSFLDDQKVAEEASEDTVEPGFLLSPLLRAISICSMSRFYKHIWTGRSSAFRTGARSENTPGKPPISRTYKISRVHPGTIAYVAVLMRFVLSSQAQFQMVNEVRHFNSAEFFNRITKLFRDPESAWCKEILASWDRYVCPQRGSVVILIRCPGGWAGSSSEVYGTASYTSKKTGVIKETAADRLERMQKAERKRHREAEREKSRQASGSSSPPHEGGPSSE